MVRVRVGVNGLGRIGRVVVRTLLEYEHLQLCAVNDPVVDSEYICYLIKHDSTHGKFKGTVINTENAILINDISIKVFHHKSPRSIPWHEADVEYVIDTSGMFTTMERASGHLASGLVRRVIVAAPSSDVPTILLGVNQEAFRSEMKILSCGSSTLHCLAPIVKILDDNLGITEGLMTSIHAMTPALKPVDSLCSKSRHYRDHRGILQNIIPGSTGACKSLVKMMPHLKNKLSGVAYRVPIVNVSVLDLTVRLQRSTDLAEIKKHIENASNSSMKGIIRISEEASVSSDFIGEKNSCIFDVNSSIALNKNFFKLMCWYENEYSYACRVLELILFAENQVELNIQTVQTTDKTIDKTDVENFNEQCILSTPKNATAEKSKDVHNLNRQIQDTSRVTVPFKVPAMLWQHEGNFSVNRSEIDQADTLQTYPGVGKKLDKPIKDLKEFEKGDQAEISFHLNGCNSVIFEAMKTKTSKQNQNAISAVNEKETALNPENMLFSQNTNCVLSSDCKESAAFEELKIILNDKYYVKPNKEMKDRYYKGIDFNYLDIETEFIPRALLQNTENEIMDSFSIISKDDDFFRILDDSLDSTENNCLSDAITFNHDKNVVMKTVHEPTYMNTDSIIGSVGRNIKIKTNNENMTESVNSTDECSSLYLHSCSGIHSMYTERNVELYDKLQSLSDLDSEKSVEIQFADVTDSIDELEKLHKMCRIIEISDELTDTLFETLGEVRCASKNAEGTSVKDYSRKIDLDEVIKSFFQKKKP